MLWSIVKDTRSDKQKNCSPSNYDLDKAAKDIAKATSQKK